MNDELTIRASEGFLAISSSRCWKCGEDTPVLSIYIREGQIEEDPQSDFTVSSITAIDDELRMLLEPYRFFHEGHSHTADTAYLANHCENCGALQGDFYLHSEPGGAFFPESPEDYAKIEFRPLGRGVRLEGDVGMGSMHDAFEASLNIK